MAIAERQAQRTPYDYTTVTVESIQADADEGFHAADALVDGVAGRTDGATYGNTMQPLDDASATIWRTFGRTGFLRYVHPDPAVREAAMAIDERVSKWRVAIAFRGDLRRRVQEYAQTDEAAALPPAQRRLVDLWLREFRRAGGDLDPAGRDELGRLRNRLVELETQFQKNIDEHEDWLELTRPELEGMDDEYVARLKPGSTPGTYRVTLAYPELYPFLRQARRRHLRQALEFKHLTRSVAINRPLLEEALRIRHAAARLLGYPSWAHYRVETKMAATPDAVNRFHDDIIPRLSEKGRAEIQAMLRMLASDEDDTTFRSWDRLYYTEQLRKREYDVDQAEVAAYLPLDAVLDGLLTITGDVFGVEYRRVHDARAWHVDVFLYEVVDRASGERVGHFYADLFPRDGKYGHAMAVPLVLARVGGPDGADDPVVTIVANLTKPSAEAPSLLRHDEVVTLFHEFGHVLEGLFARPPFAMLDFQWQEWDFVEAPSQILEHWTWQADILRRFSRHYQTGEPMRPDLVDR
ncbi:MAG: M3 family metallopeptidase, partial [Chloroflexota bacterium]|nr:M3 family metallopeptidase [Chloroflexota bacterium]